MSPLWGWFRHFSVNRTISCLRYSGMRVTLIAAIVYLLTIPQRHLADNFCIKFRCQLLTETFAVNFWLKLLVSTFDVEIWLKLLIETFAVNFWQTLLIAIRRQLLITARAIEPSSALVNSNWGMLIRVEGSIRKLLSKLEFFSCLKSVSKAELSNVRIELISTLISERVDHETWYM